MFDALKSGFKKARDLFAPMFAAQGMATPNRKEMRLDADAFAVKRKLGKSFFTKCRTPARTKRLLTLTQDELDLARAKGWV